MSPSAKPTRETQEEIQAQRQPKRALGLFDSTMVVIGVMIGSGIFLVPADMARILGGPGWFLAAWVFAAVLTIAAAFSFGELASMMPGGGGMYLYLREAYSPLWGFLYGWTLFTVIQTGTIAAVAVAFARFLGVLAPSISESRYLITPIHLSAHYALTLSTAQLVAVLVIAVLTATNTLGVEYGKIVQNSFTVAKLGALGALIVLGLTVGWNASAVHANLAAFWQRPAIPYSASSMGAILGLVVVFCVSQSGSLFAADSWHDITFASEEVKEPRTTLPRALAIGVVIVMLVYLAAKVAYPAVPNFTAIQHADHDRVATAMLQQIFPAWGAKGLAVLIMISTFGCINSLVLSGPRAHYAMARDRLFIPAAGRLNSARVPGWNSLCRAFGPGCWCCSRRIHRLRATEIFIATCWTTSSPQRCCFTFSPSPQWWFYETSGLMRSACTALLVIRWFRRFIFWAPARSYYACSSIGRLQLGRAWHSSSLACLFIG